MKHFLLLLPGLLAGLSSHAAEPLPPVTLYAPAACQPCADWAQRMRQTGFVVTEEDKEPHALHKIKRWLNVPSQHEAAHTARVAGYFIEGQVSPDAVRQLLADKPSARGLVTSLPAGEAITGEHFDTLLVGHDGGISPFARH